MKEERVIVYIDENTDDGMMWEELNQKGQMQISVYDEEFESWSEYQHSIVVKSLQEHLTDYTKQVRKEVVDKVYKVLEQAVPHDLCWSWAVIKKELDLIQAGLVEKVEG